VERDRVWANFWSIFVGGILGILGIRFFEVNFILGNQWHHSECSWGSADYF